MKVIKSIPRGYCHGVVNALNLVSKTIKDNQNSTNPLPIYILGEIVHNKNIKNAFLEVGAITLEGDSREEMLDKVKSGIIIITAHGIDSKLIQKAKDKGLIVVDATCSDVTNTHNLIKNKINLGYEVLFIGKKNHPETQGVICISSKIHLITGEKDIQNLDIQNKKLIITNQTTMSKYETKHLFDIAKNKFEQLEIIDEICNATSKRQDSALENAKKADLSLIVGDPNSNNTNKLAEISQKKGLCKTFRIETLDDLDINWLLDKSCEIVHITSGASTPTLITKEVIDFVENFDKKNKSTWNTKSQINLSRIIPRVN